jgi:hypothetical protein
MTQEEFAEHLTIVGEKYAASIDRAMTMTSLEMVSEMPEVLESAQLTALLLVAARRTTRAGLPDMALFATLKEALNAAKQEASERS